MLLYLWLTHHLVSKLGDAAAVSPTKVDSKGGQGCTRQSQRAEVGTSSSVDTFTDEDHSSGVRAMCLGWYLGIIQKHNYN